MRKKRITITLSNSTIKKVDNLIDGENMLNRSNAIETVLNRYLQSDCVKKAVILGGGEAITFRGRKISKLLLPVGDETLIERNVKILKSFGVEEIIFSLGKLGNQIREKIKDGSDYGIKVMYFERDYGNAWALRQVKSLLRETFYMMNGDILLDNIDLEDMSAFHRDNNGKGTVLIATSRKVKELGAISMKGTKIVKFEEKKDKDEEATHLINGGVYLLEPEICKTITPDFSSLEHNVFPQLASEEKLFGYLMEGKWFHLHDEKAYDKYLKDIKTDE